MKQLKLFAFGLTAAVLLTLPFGGQAAAQTANDSGQILTRTTTAIDGLSAFLSESTGMPNDEFFPAFADRADETRKAVSRAHADLAQATTYDANEAAAITALRDVLATMKKQLSDWEAAARAGDTGRFDELNEAFAVSLDEYKAAVADYNEALAAGQNAGIAFLVCLLLALVAIAVVLPWRNKNYKQLAEQATIKDNARLSITSRKFLLFSLLTFGIYSLWWAWQSWEVVAKAEGKRYHNFWRAVFIIITSFWLFPKVLELAKSEGYKGRYHPKLLAALWLVVAIGFNAATRDVNSLIALIATLLAEVTIFTLIVAPVLKAQAYYATATKKQLLPAGRGFAVLSVALLVGGMMLCMLYMAATGYLE